MATSCQAPLSFSASAGGGHIVFSGVSLDTNRRRVGGRQANTAQRCHSPLHRSLLSLLTGCNLGMKAAFSVSPPPSHCVFSNGPCQLRQQGERASLPLH